jgi:hypothetical protein
MSGRCSLSLNWRPDMSVTEFCATCGVIYFAANGHSCSGRTCKLSSAPAQVIGGTRACVAGPAGTVASAKGPR